MPWEAWIIPIIALAVWIISQLRGNEEFPPKRPRLPGEPGQQPTNDIDRFLQEINRLRQRGTTPREPHPPEPQLLEPVASAPSAEPTEPTSRPLFERFKPAAPTVSSAPPTSEPSVRPLFERPSSPPPPAPPPRQQVSERATRLRRREAPQPVEEILDVIPVAVPVALPSIPIARPLTPSPAVAQLRTLLSAPGGLQTAVLSQEVLGPPRCRQRPRLPLAVPKS